VSNPEFGEELVRLASADNFRDVTGPGYVSADDTPLRAGVFFRSNELGLTDDGRMVIPVSGTMLLVQNTPSGPEISENGWYRFVPLR